MRGPLLDRSESAIIHCAVAREEEIVLFQFPVRFWKKENAFDKTSQEVSHSKSPRYAGIGVKGRKRTPENFRCPNFRLLAKRFVITCDGKRGSYYSQQQRKYGFSWKSKLDYYSEKEKEAFSSCSRRIIR